jgi:hypothetical protein
MSDGGGPAFPSAYAPFLPVLERLSDSLVELLHGQLLQFERLARNFDWRELAPQGEFEGLGGLTLRGEISHIVQSELLLRTEAPLEFLRRLAESETLFHEKQFADPGARPVYRAMISAGPGMLGHGRLIGLAALFFMARIAHARGAEFHWCFLPREAGAVWFDQISVNTIKRFLRAVSYREMDSDDVDAARLVWETLTADAAPAAAPEYLDWVIGSDMRGPAVADSASALAFTLQPPVPGERRAAQIVVRQRGAERNRATIQLPDDRICVSALDTPFAPLKPAELAKLETSPRPKMGGWEPRHFITPRTDTKIVRMRHGLLILTGDPAWKIAQSWFVLLPDHLKLAGVGLDGQLLRIVVHTARSGRDTMILKDIALSAGAAPAILSGLRREVPSSHLFRNQPPGAIPSMSWGGDLEVYSSFGQAFVFRSRPDGGEAQFSPLLKAPKTLWSSGPYRVVQPDPDAKMLRVVKISKRHMDEFFIGEEAIGPDRLFDMVYSPAHRSLAYSVMPNVWTIPPFDWLVKRGDSGDPATIRLEPHETLLSAHGGTQQLTVRIWSDARHGGNGTVRTVRYNNGVPTLKQPVLRLGDDALSIVKIQPGDDGVWAMKVDDDQTPLELLLYRRKKKHSQSECTRFDLQALAREAVKVDLGPLDG